MPKLLIVDDALADRVRVSGIASRWNDCTILEADNGQTAMAQIEEHLPDLILTDLHMPEMNGLELVSAVKQDFPNIPVVLMTAQGSEEIAAEALRHGAASYVPKIRLGDDLLPTLSRVYTASLDADSQSRVMHYLSTAETEFVIPSDVALIKSCVARILDMLRCLPLGDEADRLRVGIAVEEAALNACYHGNLEVKTEVGHEPSKYEEVALQRMYEQPYYNRRIRIRSSITPEQAVFTVCDDGSGFDVGSIMANRELQGRGLTLMHSVMDEVEFSDNGSEVRMLRSAMADDDCDAEEE